MFATPMMHLPYTGLRGSLADMEQMMRQMDRMTRNLFDGRRRGYLPSGVFPAVNITEDGDCYYVRAELPGITADAIELQVNGRNLSISGERRIESEGENARYHRREREAGRFSRVIGLPGDIDADTIEAKMVNGLLTIAIGKSEASKPKKITVN